ncbi:F-type H+-transporting ATPase subunit epsilon [Paucidesulfovibrio gracilis DSM 16080]|jgi:F-type H+-transporting ATPase subunit epsilon|uniref:ATP synthase epsilon chain n=1 Tax=Paucidesulfovibrio gracilis DSM 16080 TaxID=1121449 RepID=A0A1T4XJ78_9BACT|nr:F0F1 ATP synthase subunit epsilon [Paucidesulfovibrio gracilis]SKA89632.1 F-type H+-transporting ATPase subunit epsilon [Paucidesulfovibrio gracilis DSM 16080]
MANTLLLEIVTPDRKVLSEDVEYVGAPGALGEFGVLPNHIPFLSALGIGNLHFKNGGKSYYVFVAGGFAEVSGNKMTVLAEVAEKASEIDIDRARKARERAEQRTAKVKENVDWARNQAALRRAIARMSCRESGSQAGTC